MTTSSTVTKQIFAGNGSATQFTIPFVFTNTSEIEVWLRNTLVSPITETQLTLTTDYTLSGGTLLQPLYVNTVATYAIGYNILIRRVVALTNTVNYQDGNARTAATDELALDQLTRMVQQHEEKLSRVPKIPKTTSVADFLMDDPIANSYLAINASGTGVTQVSTLADSGLSTVNNLTSRVASIEGLQFGLSATEGSNALILNLLNSAGNTPSSGAPAYIVFRNATSANGTVQLRTITSALSITVPANATLGHSSAVSGTLWIYALDNNGAVELAVSGGTTFDSTDVVSSTTISAGATSSSTLYSGTGRTNVAARIIGYALSTQATAGQWATPLTPLAPAYIADPISYGTRISNLENAHIAPTVQKFTSGSAATYTLPTSPFKPKYILVEMCGGGGGGGGGSGSGGAPTDGGTGGTSTFGTQLSCVGGTGGGQGNGTSTGAGSGGIGGTATLGSGPIGIATSGNGGGAGTDTGLSGSGGSGGTGGANFFGGGAPGIGADNSTGGAPIANSGAGGGGASGRKANNGSGGGGGGGGGYVRAILINPSSTYTYTVGAAGSAGAAGTSAAAGSAGAAGIIMVTEFYY